MKEDQLIFIQRSSMKKKFKTTAVITGATGGIGRSFACYLAEREYDLILTDVRNKQLQALAGILRKRYAVKIKTELTDLSNPLETSRFANKLKKLNNIEILINCAGYGEGIRFDKEKISAQLKMIRLHVMATVQLTHAVLPVLIRRRKGKIITVSSIAAFIPAPGSSIYAATKSFLNSFMESIHMEVHKYGVQVQSLCPGFTRTGFHTRLKKTGRRNKINPAIPLMEADEVVRYSFKCLDKGKTICIPGFFNKTLKHILPLLPRQSFYSITEKISE